MSTKISILYLKDAVGIILMRIFIEKSAASSHAIFLGQEVEKGMRMLAPDTFAFQRKNLSCIFIYLVSFFLK